MYGPMPAISGGIRPSGGFGALPNGIADLSGNVWEWTRSIYADYPYPEQGEIRQQREDLKAEGRRVFRGGSFGSDQDDVRCASRGDDEPDIRYYFDGFRIVVSPFL